MADELTAARAEVEWLRAERDRLRAVADGLAVSCEMVRSDYGKYHGLTADTVTRLYDALAAYRALPPG